MPPETLSDEFLNALLNKPVKVYLVNGTALTGKLLKYDTDALVLSPKTLVYKDHVSTIHEDEKKHDQPRRT